MKRFRVNKICNKLNLAAKKGKKQQQWNKFREQQNLLGDEIVRLEVT